MCGAIKTDVAAAAPFRRVSFQLIVTNYSELDERWTDRTPQRAFFNRLYWLEHGDATVYINGRKHVLEPGYLYLIPANAMLELQSDGPFGKSWCHFFAPTFNGFDLMEMLQLPVRIKPADAEEVGRLFSQLIVASERKSRGWMNVQRNAWLLELLLPFFRAAESAESVDGRQYFQPVMQYVQKHLAENIRLNDLAAVMDWSPTHFSRKFQEEFSCSPVNYLILRRVLLAERMLCLSSKSMKEICYLCGFNSESHFSTTFKKYTTRSPQRFRKIFKEKKPLPESLQQPSVLRYMYRKDNALSLHLISIWLRSDMDWLYCNIYYHVFTTTFFPLLGLDWMQVEHEVQHNILFFPVSGMGLLVVDGIEITIREGELHFVPYGSRLELRGAHNLDLHQCTFSAEREEGGDLFESIAAPSLLFPQSRDRTEKLFEALETSAKDAPQKGWQIMEQTMLLLELLLPFLRAAEEQPRDIMTFMPALKFMREHLHRPITLDEIADSMGQSAEHFNRSFRESMRIPPMHYLTEERVRRARKMLTGTRLTAQEIGLQCGFNSPSHFAKVFKRIIGLTPGQYRKRH